MHKVRNFHKGHSTVGEWQGCGREWHGMCELAFNTAWEWRGICETALRGK
jgi:hypothetical protein